MIDFTAVKQIRLTDVCAKYGIALTFGGKFAKARCPLPSHKQNDRDKNFNVNLEQNYFRCWSESCNEKAGGKGGDVINFVALMENCSQHEAAKRLCQWFNIPEKQKPGTPIEHRASEKPPKGPSQKDSSDHNSSSGSVKGYMADVDAWFDQVIQRVDQEGEEDYLHRVRNAVKTRIVQSFRNGKRVAQGLVPE